MAASVPPKHETNPKKRVVITGMGVVSVFGNDVDTYYDKLLAGENSITPIDRFDASKFPTQFGCHIREFKSEGYVDGKNDRRVDDSLKYAVVAGKKTLECSDLGEDKLDKCVVVGTGMGGITIFSNGVQALIQNDYKKVSPFFAANHIRRGEADLMLAGGTEADKLE